jgi:hypothetical protein
MPQWHARVIARSREAATKPSSLSVSIHLRTGEFDGARPFLRVGSNKNVWFARAHDRRLGTALANAIGDGRIGEARASPAFKFFDLMRERRWRDAEMQGGAREMLFLNDRHEITEQPSLDVVDSLDYYRTNLWRTFNDSDNSTILD